MLSMAVHPAGVVTVTKYFVSAAAVTFGFAIVSLLNPVEGDQ